MISRDARIGENVTIKQNVIIEADVAVCDNCYLDYGCILRRGVVLGEGSYVGPHCILGEFQMDFHLDRGQQPMHTLEIGKSALIRSHSVIYNGSTFGEYLQTGHRVTVREKTMAGTHLRIGTLTDIQGHCEIGNYVNMHSNVHIGMHTKIGNFVWIFPYSVTTNDPIPPSDNMCGCVIGDYSIVATGTILLPGMELGEHAFVGAGSVVTKSVPAYMFAVGSPAKVKGSISQIKDPETGVAAYPWPDRFSRFMPWQESGFQIWNNENQNA